MSLLTGHGEWEEHDYDNWEDHGSSGYKQWLKDQEDAKSIAIPIVYAAGEEEIDPEGIASLQIQFTNGIVKSFTKTSIIILLEQHNLMLDALKHINKMIVQPDAVGMIPMGSIKELTEITIERVEEK